MYFLNLLVSIKKVNSIMKELKEIEVEIEYYENVHPGDLWIKDLEELEVQLEKIYPDQWGTYPGYGSKHMKCPD